MDDKDFQIECLKHKLEIYDKYVKVFENGGEYYISLKEGFNVEKLNIYEYQELKDGE